MKTIEQKQPISEVYEKLKGHPLVFLRNKLLEGKEKVEDAATIRNMEKG